MSDELQADLEGVHRMLWEFAGSTATQRAQHAVERIEYLKLALSVSEYNERAAMDVLEQDRLELFALRSKMRLAKECMRANDPANARVIFGPEETGHGNPGTQSHRVPVGENL